MKKTMTAIALSSLILTTSFIAPQAYAQEKNIIEHIEEIPTEEKVGVSIGAIIGGIFGGPPGAFITAIAGDFIAKNMLAEEEISALQTQVEKQQLSATNAKHKHNGEMKNLEMQYQQEVMNIANSYENSEKAQVENILVSLMFRTGSSVIEPHYEQQVQALAQVLQRSPHLNIDLSGYTDKQGDEQRNLQLAEQRISSVKQLLLDEGINEQRIFTNAFGEMAPVDETIASEVNYFDRRVVMKLKVDSEEVAKQANL